MLRFYF
jgi:hypothetical protein